MVKTNNTIQVSTQIGYLTFNARGLKRREDSLISINYEV